MEKTKLKETKIIPEGSATPYVAIFDPSGKPILDPSNELPIGTMVSSFSYEFVEIDEEEDDGNECEIIIETNNPNLVSIPPLHPAKNLLVQWGWIFPDGTSVSGKVVMVTIEQVKCSFSENGLKMTITGCDPFLAAAKNTSPAFRNNLLFEQWIDMVASGGGFSIKDYSQKDLYYTVVTPAGDLTTDLDANF